MVGAVLYQEMLLGSRHGRWHRFRWIYAIWLLLVLAFMLSSVLLYRGRPNFTALSLCASQFLQFFTSQHFLLLTMATPVLVAGTITDEKSRGTLQYLLTADLLSWELILGKLIGRLFQVFSLVLIGVPLFCFFGVFAGLDLLKLLGFLACSLVLLFGLGSASVLFSVWCRHTREAVLSLYFLGLLVSLILGLTAHALAEAGSDRLLSWLELVNPFLPLGPDWLQLRAGEYLNRLGNFALFWCGLGLVCLTLGTARLRSVYRRHLESGGKLKKHRWWHLERPPVSNWPLSWKERYVEGIAPLGLLRHLPVWLGVVLVFFLSLVIYGGILVFYLPAGVTLASLWDMLVAQDFVGLLNVARRLNIPHYVFWGEGMSVTLLTMLVIGVRCSGAVTGEREKQTWEALLMTPLSTRQLIRGKLWGIAGACVPYLIAYAVPAVVLSVIAGPAAFLWTLLWLGVMALAIWYAGAAGLYCSVMAKSSWRSLLNTLLFIYLWGILIFLLLFVFACILAFFIFVIYSISYFVTLNVGGGPGPRDFVDILLIAYSLTLAAAFLFLSWRLLAAAEYRVGILERTKHWKDEPKKPALRPRRVRRSRQPL